MKKDHLFCYGNSKNAGELIGKCGYFGDSEEEIQQRIDSGAATEKCVRVDIGIDYATFYPKPEAGTLVRSYYYFYCVDFFASKSEKLLACPETEAPLEEMQAYTQQQFRIILHQLESASLQCIYDCLKILQTKNEFAKQLFTDLQRYYNAKQQQLRDALISDINNEKRITSDALRAYAGRLDEIDALACLEEDFDSLQELLYEYNI